MRRCSCQLWRFDSRNTYTASFRAVAMLNPDARWDRTGMIYFSSYTAHARFHQRILVMSYLNEGVSASHNKVAQLRRRSMLETKSSAHHPAQISSPILMFNTCSILRVNLELRRRCNARQARSQIRTTKFDTCASDNCQGCAPFQRCCLWRSSGLPTPRSSRQADLYRDFKAPNN